MEKAILNLDQNFFSTPTFHGNGMVVEKVENPKSVKRKQWIEVSDIFDKIGFKIKKGLLAKKSQTLLYNLNDIDLTDKTLIHIGMHSHLYSYKGLKEFDLKEIPQFYRDHNAFIYLFKHRGLKKMIWLVPDYYTGGEIYEHFPEGKFKAEKKYYKMMFQDFQPGIYVSRWKDFNKWEDYNINYFTVINNEPNVLSDSEREIIRNKIIR